MPFLLFIIFNFHLYITIIKSFNLRGKLGSRVANRSQESGLNKQQANALPTELCSTLAKLYPAPLTELHPNWATLQSS